MSKILTVKKVRFVRKPSQDDNVIIQSKNLLIGKF